MAVASAFTAVDQWSSANMVWMVHSCLLRKFPRSHQDYWQGTQAEATSGLAGDRPHAIPTVLGLVHAVLPADSASSSSVAMQPATKALRQSYCVVSAVVCQVFQWITAIALASHSCGDGSGVGTGFSQRLRGDRPDVDRWTGPSLTGWVAAVVGRTVTDLLVAASVTVRRVAHWIVAGDWVPGSWLDSPGVTGKVSSYLRCDRLQSYQEMPWAIAPEMTVDDSVPLSPINQTVPATVRRVAHWAIALLLTGKKGQSLPEMQELIPASLPGCSSRSLAPVPSTISCFLPIPSQSPLLPVQVEPPARLPKPNQSISRFLPLNRPVIATGIAAPIPHWVLPDVVTAFCAAMITAFCAAISAAVIDSRMAAEEQAVSNIRVT